MVNGDLMCVCSVDGCVPALADRIDGIWSMSRMALRGRQRLPQLEQLESTMSSFSVSLDHYDLQVDTEELDMSCSADNCDSKMLGQ